MSKGLVLPAGSLKLGDVLRITTNTSKQPNPATKRAKGAGRKRKSGRKPGRALRAGPASDISLSDRSHSATLAQKLARIKQRAEQCVERLSHQFDTGEVIPLLKEIIRECE